MRAGRDWSGALRSVRPKKPSFILDAVFLRETWGNSTQLVQQSPGRTSRRNKIQAKEHMFQDTHHLGDRGHTTPPLPPP